MEQNLFVELLAALDVLVLKPIDLNAGLFRRVGIAPTWAARFLEGPLADDNIEPARLFPFLEDFFVDASHLWRRGGTGRLHSGIWTEVDAAGEEQLLEATALCLSGEPILVISSAQAYGQIRSVIQKARAVQQSLGQDLARQRTAQEQLTDQKNSAEHAAASKSKFLSHMTHELRTPLNVVIGFSELIMDDAKAKGQTDLLRDLGKIRSAARHLLALIGDILDLSKLEAGRTHLHLETFNLASLVGDIAAAVQPLMEKSGNTLRTKISPNVGNMQGDATKIRQCLLNLLGNAAKFTQNGTVTFSADREVAPTGEHIQMAVSDTGIGMSPEQLSQLFQPFTQAEPSTTMKFGGTGLGLAISRELCRLMGGEISVKSEQGAGTTFKIELPLVQTGESAA